MLVPFASSSFAVAVEIALYSAVLVDYYYDCHRNTVNEAGSEQGKQKRGEKRRKTVFKVLS